MTWRYQSVYVDETLGRTFSVCEVYFDDNGNLESWTEPYISASGDTAEELCRDLDHMMADAAKWEPVAFDSLCKGMQFKEATR